MGGLRHGEVWHWLRVTRQDANLGLTGSRGLLGEEMERKKTISLVYGGQEVALNYIVWNYLETFIEHSICRVPC